MTGFGGGVVAWDCHPKDVDLFALGEDASTSFKNRTTLVSQQLKHLALDDSDGGRLLYNR
jgi:hypothetical protein